jgi:hypothetical protein
LGIKNPPMSAKGRDRKEQERPCGGIMSESVGGGRGMSDRMTTTARRRLVRNTRMSSPKRQNGERRSHSRMRSANRGRRRPTSANT